MQQFTPNNTGSEGPEQPDALPITDWSAEGRGQYRVFGGWGPRAFFAQCSYSGQRVRVLTCNNPAVAHEDIAIAFRAELMKGAL